MVAEAVPNGVPWDVAAFRFVSGFTLFWIREDRCCVV